ATSFTWTGWPNCEDLKVQRINLSSLFVRLILTTNISESGYYSINTTSTNYNVPTSQGKDGYFIQNTVLYLYVGRTNLDTQQLLTRDTSYVYEQNIWRSSLTGGSFLAGSLDLGSVVDKYLEAPENRNAMYTLTNNLHGNTNVSLTQQSVVVSNMVAYMSNYNAWADSNFADNNKYNAAVAVQAKLK